MPKINANSISEHRSRRELEIIEVTQEILKSKGVDEVNYALIASRLGISRSSIYNYFDSIDVLIADVLIDELLSMKDLLSTNLKGRENPRDIIYVWVHTSLNYIIDGRHTLVQSFGALDFPAHKRMQLGVLHQELTMPLIKALEQIGISNPSRVASQISVLTNLCVKRIQDGNNPDEEIEAILNLLDAGLNLGLHK